MSSSYKTLFGAAILAICASGCPDPAKSFSDFDKRVIDAGKTVVGTACGGELPDISGEFYLQLAPSLAPTALLQFIATTTLDKTVDPALLTLTLQPLCAQEAQCTLRQPIGNPFTVMSIEVNEQCQFETDITGMPVPGGANAISGSDLIGNLVMLGNIIEPDFYCGIINGEAIVGGAGIPIDGSDFGAVRITPGTLGDSLQQERPSAEWTLPSMRESRTRCQLMREYRIEEEEALATEGSGIVPVRDS
ncbi:MAG: hypothetical protein JKY56_04320, partial [Kofleriaceae bacterium]|nr:hypothetical protein [Kofleriaceae bacterium]